MDMNTYLEESARTVSPDFNGDMVPAKALSLTMEYALASAVNLDAMKKALFYGKKSDLVDHHVRVTESREDLDHIEDTDIVHAILGLHTETAELVQILNQAMVSGELQLDRLKVLNEAGDVLWYLALLFRALETTFENVAGANIDKLKIRYPEKFAAEQAISPNHAEEDAAVSAAIPQ
jgi:NTP pyrophosphatase (non-canonical NTP hydrolase)